jgi:hypothetical protein
VFVSVFLLVRVPLDLRGIVDAVEQRDGTSPLIVGDGEGGNRDSVQAMNVNRSLH